MEIRHKKNCLYSANSAWNALLTGMKTSPKFVLSGSKHTRLMDFSLCLWKESLTQKYSGSAELGMLTHSVFSLGGLNFCHGRFSLPGQKEFSRPKQRQAQKQESLGRYQARRAVQICTSLCSASVTGGFPAGVVKKRVVRVGRMQCSQGRWFLRCLWPSLQRREPHEWMVGWQQEGLRAKRWQGKTRQCCREIKKLLRGAGSRHPTATTLFR